MANAMTIQKQLPLEVVGSTKFGRYPKISAEQTFNMIISDECLVSAPGYKIAVELLNDQKGRQIFFSTRWNKMIASIGNAIYTIQENLVPTLLFTISTSVGNVFIEENNNFQIAVCDQKDIWIYNWKNNTLIKAGTPIMNFNIFLTRDNITNENSIDKKNVFIKDLGDFVNISFIKNNGDFFNIIKKKDDSFNNVNFPGPAGSNIEINNDSLYKFIQKVTAEENPLNFTPGNITYQDTYFIAPDISVFQNVAPPLPSDQNSTWRLSQSGNGTIWPFDAQHQGTIQTKPDYAIATIRVPGRENLLFVMGRTVTEPWYDIGANLFPYQRSTTTSIDYGVLNVATVDTNDQFVAWVGYNEKSGYAIIYSDGGDFKQISTDGINYKIEQLKNPKSCFGFLYKQYGHIFYQFTFYDPQDNLTYIYDFSTNAFFSLTDENQNAHIAKSVAFFNNTYYFVSTIDGNIYELSNKYNTYKYANKEYVIPRYRVCPNLRDLTADYYRIDNIEITIEQGDDPNVKYSFNGNLSTEDGSYIETEDYNPIAVTNDHASYRPRIDLALSKDGGESFSSFLTEELKPIGKRRNKVIWYQLGCSNDTCVMFHFVSKWRVVVISAQISIAKRGNA